MKLPNLERWIRKNWPTHTKLRERINSTCRSLSDTEKEQAFEFYKNMKEVSPDTSKSTEDSYEKLYKRSFFKCLPFL